jgi:hypothetical protein
MRELWLRKLFHWQFVFTKIWYNQKQANKAQPKIWSCCDEIMLRDEITGFDGTLQALYFAMLRYSFYFSLRYVMVLCVMVKLYCTFSKLMYVYSQVCEWCPSAWITTTPHHGHAWTRRHQSQTGTARDLLMWNPVLYGKALHFGALHYVKVQHVWYVKRHKISKFRNK